MRPLSQAIKKVIENPSLVIGELRKHGLDANRRLHALAPFNGVNVMAEDWDNLLLLDGCRYDMYKNAVGTPTGRLQQRRSQASASKPFLQRNFDGRRLHDTVYVTANPFFKTLADDTFHAIYDTFDDWDDALQTVHPEDVAEAAIRAKNHHPDKRLIVHFMQPHYPFIGEYGRNLDHRGFARDQDDSLPPSVWVSLQYGYNDYENITIDNVWRAYNENLEIVLDEVRELIPDLVGRTVISADHGNLVGERILPFPVRGFGHPPGIRTAELVNIPWHIIPADERKTVTSEQPIETSNGLEEPTVERKLKALGYR